MAVSLPLRNSEEQGAEGKEQFSVCSVISVRDNFIITKKSHSLMRTLISTILFVAFVISSNAQVNFTKDIAPIIYNNCTKCHRPGEIAPFAMTNYDEILPWAQSIQYVTSIRYMPPWKADPSFSRFQGERFLSQQQIDLIAEWVANGAPFGNAAEEPSIPDFPTGSQIGTPDLILHYAESYHHSGGSQDE